MLSTNIQQTNWTLKHISAKFSVTPNKQKSMDIRGLWSVVRLHCVDYISHRAWHRPAWKALTDTHKFQLLLGSQLQFTGWHKRDPTLNKEWRLQKCTALTMLGNPHSVLSRRWLCSLPCLSRLLSRTSTPTTHGFMGLGYFLIAALITVSQGCLRKEEVRVSVSIWYWIASNSHDTKSGYRLCNMVQAVKLHSSQKSLWNTVMLGKAILIQEQKKSKFFSPDWSKELLMQG